MENVEEARPASGVVSLVWKFTSIEDENFPQSIPKEVMCMTGGKDSELEQSVCVAGFVEIVLKTCPHARRVRRCDCESTVIYAQFRQFCKPRIGFFSNCRVDDGQRNLRLACYGGKMWGDCVYVQIDMQCRLRPD